MAYHFTKCAMLIFAVFLISISIQFISAKNVPANVGDKETMETINEFIELGQKINKNPNAIPDGKEANEFRKKWFNQMDFDKDGQVTVEESVKYQMQKMMPIMMAMAQDKKNANRFIGWMRQMAAGQMGLMDMDKDVKLSRAEFEKAFGKMVEGIVADAKQ